jgi:hypothetical protein
LPADEGIVTSLNGDPIDIAVARDLGARFVQLSLEDSPRCSFRLSEKVLLRVKEPNAIFHLHP